MAPALDIDLLATIHLYIGEYYIDKCDVRDQRSYQKYMYVENSFEAVMVQCSEEKIFSYFRSGSKKKRDVEFRD